MKNIKKPILSALTFFLTLGVLSIGYGMFNPSMSTVSPGETLTASGWNDVINNILDINSRLGAGLVSSQWITSGSDISFTGGNVSISGSLSAGGSPVWTQGNLTNLNQLTNGPGYLTGSSATQWTTNGSNIGYAAGNVGIGTSSPSTMLNLVGTDKSASITLENTGDGGTYPSLAAYAFGAGHSSILGFRANGTKTSPTIIPPAVTLNTITGNGYNGTAFYELGRISILTGDNFDANNLDGKIQFQVKKNNAANIAMTINESGNIGIGTTVPSEKLEVNGNIKLPSTSSIIFGSAWGSGSLKIQNGATTAFSISSTAGAGVTSNVGFYSAAGTVNYPSFGISGQAGLGLGLYSPSANSLGLVTSAIERVKISSNGNVGIGIDPTEKLEVNGNLKVNGSLIFSGGSTPVSSFLFPTANYLTKFVVGGQIGNSSVYDNGTNVGIGTTDPRGTLDVKDTSFISSTSNPILYLNYSARAAGTRGRIIFNGDNTIANIAASIDAIYTGNSINSALTFNTYNGTSNTEKLRITDNGNVGIGTSNPSTRIDVRNLTAAGTYAYFGASSDGGARGLQFTSSDNGIFLGGIHKIDATSAYGIIDLATGGATRLRINSDGNVGIGTTSPSDLLTISGGAARKGINVTSDGDANAYNDIIQEVTTQSGITTGKPVSWRMSLRKDGYFSGDNSGPTWEFFGIRKGGGYFAPLLFKTNGDVILAGAATNATNGNVGIGTTSPNSTLHANKTSGNNAEIDIQSTSATGSHWALYHDRTSESLNLWHTGATNVMTFSSGGSVGIGTTSPSAKLDVWAPSIYTKPSSNLATASVSYSSTGFGNNDGGLGIFKSSNSDGTYPKLTFGAIYGNGGNIPGAMGLGSLDFAGYSQLDSKYLLGAYIRSYATNAWSSNNASSYLDFGTNSGSSAPTSRLRITESGNVGIGTTEPGDKLHVVGTASIQKNTTDLSGILTSFAPFTIKQISTNGALGMGYSPTYSAGFIQASAIGTSWDKLLLNPLGGNVAIGTTDPGAYKLYVAGNAWTSGTWGSSDQRWKKNIKTLDGTLDKINKLRGVNFEWKKDEFKKMNFDSGSQIGFIAQEVEKVFPELVKTNSDGFKAVSYDKFAAVLIEGIKELEKKIESLFDKYVNQQKEIDSLKKENKEIFKKLEMLEKKIK